ncbi:uncharacterized protein I303_101947 [Kwoniella dejecticola CBS 10117]|uniref:Anaphase-promoting complex subunit 4-like WD40 domain-containing protein n=1 Tax=Kwoniella dejecticola CBS 10117 TaxID=1296121 RepID=A0A1A6ACE5_9TREE|nr:uncharacterized protein I303_01917 [Kwoniella dejecticola CBS 10117]OBR87708.1 hypothetical protein I303_01917 [Kwoniella dejecticola CBS 10117]
MVNENDQPYRPDFFPIAQPGARDLQRPTFGRSQDIRGGNVKHVRSVAWSCDGRRVATGGEFKELLVWDTKLNLEARASTSLPSSSKTSVHNGHVGSIAWSPVDPNILVSGDKGSSAGGVIAVWDVSNRSSPVATFKIPGDVLHISFHPSGRHFAVVCPQRNKDEVFFYWLTTIDGEEKWARRDDIALGGALMDLGAEEINSLRFTNSGKLVCAVSNDGSINAWIYPSQLQMQEEPNEELPEPRIVESGPSTTPSTPKILAEEPAETHKSREGSREGSPENNRDDKDTAEEDTDMNGEENSKPAEAEEPSEPKKNNQADPQEEEDKKPVNVEQSGDVEMAESAQDPEPIPTRSTAPSRQPTPPVPSSEPAKPAEKKKARQLQRFRHAVCHSASLLSLAFDPQGKYLAVGGQDALLSMFDSRDWICERTFDICTSAIRHIAFSHDGEFIALGGDDTYIAIVSVYTGALVAKLPVYGMVSSIAWHPKTNWLAYSYSGKVASPIWHIVHQET